MVWKMGYNTLASWCINRFLYEHWTRPFYNANVSWYEEDVEIHAPQIILHVLHQLQCPFLPYTRNVHPLINERVHPIVHHTNPLLHSLYMRQYVGTQMMRLFNHAQDPLNKFKSLEHHAFIQCCSSKHIWLWFPNIFDRTQSLHGFLLQSKCAISNATFISKAL